MDKFECQNLNRKCKNMKWKTSNVWRCRRLTTILWHVGMCKNLLRQIYWADINFYNLRWILYNQGRVHHPGNIIVTHWPLFIPCPAWLFEIIGLLPMICTLFHNPQLYMLFYRSLDQYNNIKLKSVSYFHGIIHNM